MCTKRGTLRVAARLALRIANEDEWTNETLFDALKACDTAREVLVAAMYERHASMGA